MRSGIYAIIHRESGRWYVGQSQNLDKRWSDHVWRLKNNRHGNPLLQRAWNKYGPDAFDFDVLILAPAKLLNALEQAYLDDPETSHFNVARCAEAPARGKKPPPRTEEYRAKIRASKLGRPLPPAHRANIGLGQIGRVVTPETRARISASLKRHHGR